jgi:hypothetical protein
MRFIRGRKLTEVKISVSNLIDGSCSGSSGNYLASTSKGLLQAKVVRLQVSLRFSVQHLHHLGSYVWKQASRERYQFLILEGLSKVDVIFIAPPAIEYLHLLTLELV